MVWQNHLNIINKLYSKKISKNFDILVSSDGENILSLASENEAIPFKRSSDLALDDSSSEDVLLEVINKFSNIKNYDSIIFLQCTSPLTTHRDIEGAIKIADKLKTDPEFYKTVSDDAKMYARTEFTKKKFLDLVFNKIHF